MELLPASIAPIEAVGLIAFSYITSAVTAAFGLGGGVMMLAAMASILPALAVIPVHGAVQLGSNGGRALMMRQHVDWQILRYFVIGSLVGAAIASQIVVVLPREILRLVLGAFILWVVWAPKLTKRQVGPGTFIPIGIATTFASMFVGATGLLIGAFLSPAKYGRMTTVGTHAICAMLQHGLKIIVFALIGFTFWEWLPLVAMMLVTGLIGTISGRVFLEKLPEKVFSRIFKTLLTLLALRLVVLAVTDLVYLN